MVDEGAIAERFRLLSEQPVLDERGRRLWAAAEARCAGHGGIAAVVRATGISESTVLRGLADLERGEVLEAGRVRRPGAGGVAILEREPGLGEDLERLVDPVTRGDPESPLRWTSKSAAKLAQALREMGHDVVDRTVHLDWLRWPDGFVCPRCGHVGGWRAADRRWRCAGCDRRVSATAGTIFHGTRTPLTVWLAAAWQMTSSKLGISAIHLQREMGLAPTRLRGRSCTATAR